MGNNIINWMVAFAKSYSSKALLRETWWPLPAFWVAGLWSCRSRVVELGKLLSIIGIDPHSSLWEIAFTDLSVCLSIYLSSVHLSEVIKSDFKQTIWPTHIKLHTWVSGHGCILNRRHTGYWHGFLKLVLFIFQRLIELLTWNLAQRFLVDLSDKFVNSFIPGFIIYKIFNGIWSSKTCLVHVSDKSNDNDNDND